MLPLAFLELLLSLVVFCAASKLTWLSALSVVVCPAWMLLPCSVRLLPCPSPVALIETLPPAVSVLPRALSALELCLDWLLLEPTLMLMLAYRKRCRHSERR